MTVHLKTPRLLLFRFPRSAFKYHTVGAPAAMRHLKKNKNKSVWFPTCVTLEGRENVALG